MEDALHTCTDQCLYIPCALWIKSKWRPLYQKKNSVFVCCCLRFLREAVWGGPPLPSRLVESDFVFQPTHAVVTSVPTRHIASHTGRSLCTLWRWDLRNADISVSSHAWENGKYSDLRVTYPAVMCIMKYWKLMHLEKDMEAAVERQQ